MKYKNPNLFTRVKQEAKPYISDTVMQLIPDGLVKGNEYLPLNPTRADKNIGSFCINLRTGSWADFAIGDRGNDIISLVAYIKGISQLKAAKEVASIIGMEEDYYA